jgi:serine/threonine protein phosphatase PrpC
MNAWSSRLGRAVTNFWPGRSDQEGDSDPSINEAPAAYTLQTCMATDIGCVRAVNQDAIAFVSPGDHEERNRRGVLAVLADGMGGHHGGEVASKLAVETICRHYFAAHDEDPERAIELALRKANAAIFRAAEADPALSGMGTTATALVLVGRRVCFVHVGDSRLYRCSPGQVRQLSKDDTLVQQMVNDGLITPERARHHPERSVLLRSLGTRPELAVSAQRCDRPEVGDTFVLCSDGLYESVEPRELAQVVESLDPQAACRRLIELARERDGSDNISVGIIAVRPAAAGEKRVPVTREMLVGPVEGK